MREKELRIWKNLLWNDESYSSAPDTTKIIYIYLFKIK